MTVYGAVGELSRWCLCVCGVCGVCGVCVVCVCVSVWVCGVRVRVCVCHGLANRTGEVGHWRPLPAGLYFVRVRKGPDFDHGFQARIARTRRVPAVSFACVGIRRGGVRACVRVHHSPHYCMFPGISE